MESKPRYGRWAGCQRRRGRLRKRIAADTEALTTNVPVMLLPE
jgi:hypothetical protein